jgi:hypothetical protein
VVGIAGAVGLIGLLAMCMLATERGAFLYRGGFLLVDLASLAVIAAVAHPAVRFGRAFSIPLLVYLGTRSYSIYLWHWPVFALTRPGVDLSAGPVVVFVLRVVITLILADLSYRLVEAPIRSGAVGRWAQDWRLSRGVDRARRTTRVFLVGSTAAISLLLVGHALVSAKPKTNDIEESLRAGQEALAGQSTIAPLTVPAVTHPPDGGGLVATGSVVATSAVTSATVPGTLPPVVTTTTTAPPPPIPTIALGDSVMLGAAGQLLQALGGSTYVDAVVGRQYKEALPIIQALAAQGRLGRSIVLHLGNNGPVSTATFRSVMDALAKVPLVLVVNVRVTKPWEPTVNTLLAQQVATYPNAKLLDWWTASAMNGDWFYKDKTHLNPNGARAYALLVANALGVGAAPPTTPAPATTPAPTTAVPTTRPPPPATTAAPTTRPAPPPTTAAKPPAPAP